MVDLLLIFKRKIDRLPWPYGECTDEFEQSPLSTHLRRTGQRDLLKHRIYTYEVSFVQNNETIEK